MDAIKNKSKSEQEGRPIFDEKEMVEVKIPGDKQFSYVGEVTDVERHRWPEIYAAFKRGEERAASGTPLEHWPNAELNKSRVAELKAQNILSVEELAGISDSTLPKLGIGARELREQARAYIERAKEGAGTSKLSAEVARLTELVERLTNSNITSFVPDKPPVVEPQRDKSIEECSDTELKAFIRRETGEGIRGNPSRDTLLKRVAEIANSKAEAV
jgi:hypothetical protein